MRSALWILVLFAAAVAAALFLSNNRATVTLFWHPWRIDFSLNLLLVLLAVMLAIAALLVHAIASVWRMPAEARIWRDHRQDMAAHHAFVRAVGRYSHGQWPQALEETAHTRQLLAALRPANEREAQEQQNLLQASTWLEELALRAKQESDPEAADTDEGAESNFADTARAGEIDDGDESDEAGEESALPAPQPKTL